MTEQTSDFPVRFGMVAIEKGFIDVDQLAEALIIQVRENAEGKPHRRVGEILADLAYMMPSQIDEVLRDMAAGRDVAGQTKEKTPKTLKDGGL